MSEKLYLKDIKKNPNDPRRKRRESFIKVIADSIDRVGLLEPIIVNADKTLVDGHYRLAALKLIGKEWLCWDKEKRIATLPRDKDFDTDFDSGVVNFLRDPQSPLEKALFLDRHIQKKIVALTSVQSTKQLLDHMKHVTHHGIKSKLSSEQTNELYHILNSVRIGLSGALDLVQILDWPEFLQEVVDEDKISLSYGMELSRLKDEETIKKLLGAIEKHDFKHAEVRKWVNVIKEKPETEKLLDKLIELEIDKGGRGTALKIFEATISRNHIPSDDELTEIVEFIKESKDKVDEWTEVRIDQAVDAMVDGKRLETIKIIPDADQRMLDKYDDIVNGIYHFDADHIRNLHSVKAKNEAINYLWKVENHIRKTLRDLNEINVLDAEYINVERG